ncbi:outer membrane usher protein [Citrobacter youngae]|nr:outer membrane usher protein [Citrobacter youngae]
MHQFFDKNKELLSIGGAITIVSLPLLIYIFTADGDAAVKSVAVNNENENTLVASQMRISAILRTEPQPDSLSKAKERKSNTQPVTYASDAIVRKRKDSHPAVKGQALAGKAVDNDVEGSNKLSTVSQQPKVEQLPPTKTLLAMPASKSDEVVRAASPAANKMDGPALPVQGEGAQTASVGSENVEFDARFLNGNAQAIDVNRYSKGNPLTPGRYNLDILINKDHILTSMVVFMTGDDGNVFPCVTEKVLTQLGVKYDLKGHKGFDSGGDTCFNLQAVIPDVKIDYNSEKQELNLFISQLYLNRQPDGYIDPALWDPGIVAGILSYDANAYHSASSQDTNDSIYAGLKYGLNLGNWRLRSRGSVNWESGENSKYNSQDAYLQRDIATLKSQLILGQSSTRGDTFDSIAVKGVHLYNDDRMLTSSETGYAPVVNGVANTNAKVTIRQNGNIIKQLTVPPGPFAITDIYPSGFGNDLDVTVTEADGKEQHFSVPFSSVSQLLRKGNVRWEAAVGQLDQEGLYHQPNVATASAYYGLTNQFTAYAGFQFTDEQYSEFLLGGAFNTWLGAMAFDATQSRATLPGLSQWTGNSYRLTYSEQFSQSLTSLNIAAYRYATEHYLSLSDAVSVHDQLENTRNQQDWVLSDYQRIKDKLQVNISQPLNYRQRDYGSLYVTGSWNKYWSEEHDVQYSLGYSNAFFWGTYSITAQRSYDQNNNTDDSLYLSFNIPLDNLSPSYNSSTGFSNINVGMSKDSNGSSQMDTSASGNTEDNVYNYSVNASYAAESQQSGDDIAQVGGYGSYNSRFGPWNASVSSSSDGNKQSSIGASGGIVLHHGGVTFVPDSIDAANTMALVSAPGAQGSHVGSGSGEIDGNGYAVVTNLSPYHQNMVSLDISKLDDSVELENTGTSVIPDAGAVLLVSFKTKVGTPYIFDLLLDNGAFIPFGADVYNDKHEWLGNVGQGGKVFLRGMNPVGSLTIVWGKAPGQSCTAHYHLPEASSEGHANTLLPPLTCKTP